MSPIPTPAPVAPSPHQQMSVINNRLEDATRRVAAVANSIYGIRPQTQAEARASGYAGLSEENPHLMELLNRSGYWLAELEEQLARLHDLG